MAPLTRSQARALAAISAPVSSTFPPPPSQAISIPGPLWQTSIPTDSDLDEDEPQTPRAQNRTFRDILNSSPTTLPPSPATSPSSMLSAWPTLSSLSTLTESSFSGDNSRSSTPTPTAMPPPSRLRRPRVDPLQELLDRAKKVSRGPDGKIKRLVFSDHRTTSGSSSNLNPMEQALRQDSIFNDNLKLILERRAADRKAWGLPDEEFEFDDENENENEDENMDMDVDRKPGTGMRMEPTPERQDTEPVDEGALRAARQRLHLAALKVLKQEPMDETASTVRGDTEPVSESDWSRSYVSALLAANSNSTLRSSSGIKDEPMDETASTLKGDIETVSDWTRSNTGELLGSRSSATLSSSSTLSSTSSSSSESDVKDEPMDTPLDGTIWLCWD